MNFHDNASRPTGAVKAGRPRTGGEPATVDGSFQFQVDLTSFGDIQLTLVPNGINVILEPTEAARMCREIWEALRISNK